MCQLFGMNCNTPTDVNFSFTGFAQRGGRTDHHSDGWGIVARRHLPEEANHGVHERVIGITRTMTVMHLVGA